MRKEIDEQTAISGDRFFETENPEAAISPRELSNLNRRFGESEPDEVLQWAAQKFGTDMVIGTGFGPSGVLLIHKAVTLQLPATIFFLDTKLLFPDTYRLRDEFEIRFGIEIEAVSTALSLEDQAREFGDELWKSNPDKCCYLRKVLPLQNYLSAKSAWVTGVRRTQASTRIQTEMIEWDPVNRVVKINPLVAWSSSRVWEYIREHNLPYNPLHDHGYPTIGCIPCTQPADSEEDERSGRWKNLDKTECGIHLPAQRFRDSLG